jgi:hypothetical protein
MLSRSVAKEHLNKLSMGKMINISVIHMFALVGITGMSTRTTVLEINDIINVFLIELIRSLI